MPRIDRWIGLGLILLGSVVFWSGRGFPNVPGQKLGAAFLPMLVGAGLALSGALLFMRSRARPSPGSTDAGADADAAGGLRAPERLGPPLVVLATVSAYIILAPRLGFLLVAPLCLVALFRTLGSSWRMSLTWAVAGTVVVHVAFYKLLRVPLPWGVLRPFY